MIISGVPQWVGIYDESDEECRAIGELRGHAIAVVAQDCDSALWDWAIEAELCRHWCRTKDNVGV